MAWRTACGRQSRLWASFTLCSRAVNMRVVQAAGPTQLQRRWVDPVCLVPRDTSTRCGFRRSVHRASTFLRPLAPRPLQALHRYYGRSDSCPALLRRTGLPDSCARPSGHSVSNHLAYPRRRFRTLPLSAVGFPPFARGVWASPFASRLASYARPNRVRHPTDWPFTSCCFPPRLAATRLHSVTGRRAHTWGGLAPP